jgi:cystathionine gamma-synthase
MCLRCLSRTSNWANAAHTLATMGHQVGRHWKRSLVGLKAVSSVSFSFGMAGIAAIFDQLRTGSMVALSDDCYQAVAGLAKAGQSRGRWALHRVAVDDTARWVEMCGVADLIWLESPSNPLLTVADLDTICAAPRNASPGTRT